jgi:hypothetical protein
MVVPASFMYLTESSGRAVFYLASDTIIRIGRAALSTTVRALANVNNAQLLLAVIASVVEFQKEVLEGKLAKISSAGRKIGRYHCCVENLNLILFSQVVLCDIMNNGSLHAKCWSFMRSEKHAVGM